MLFSAGIQWRYIAIAGAALVIAAPLAWLYLMSNDQKLRVLALFIPDLDTNGILYQQYNAKIAIGSGGGFGEGLFIGEHVYVPEIHNDFIFSFVGQSLGFVGACLLFCFCFLSVRVCWCFPAGLTIRWAVYLHWRFCDDCISKHRQYRNEFEYTAGYWCYTTLF